ncbi:MAG: hypothetical protein LBG96_16170 [Tannerella sp.]|jgi:hypothetical protein|nr:hypothetical protein [Tannerella sp.]
MKIEKDIDILQAIDTVDKIVDIVALKWMSSNNTAIRIEFMKVFAGVSPELISHYLDKWDGDFASFYLNSDEGMRRKIFTYYSIPLEPDKYSADDDSLTMALINGVQKFDVFPFESHVVHLFYLMAYNNPLELLKTIAPDTFHILNSKKMDMYGNGLNWSKAWTICADYDKERIVEYILNEA